MNKDGNHLALAKPPYCLTPLLLLILLTGCSSVWHHARHPHGRQASRGHHGGAGSYTVGGHTYYVLRDARGFHQRGIASWYGKKFQGRRTASGERFNMYDMTAAHKTLPMNTRVRVTNLDNGRSVVVRINDRGPFYGGRIIDVTYAAAAKLGMLGRGTAQVEIVAITPGDVRPLPPSKPSASAPAPKTSHTSRPGRFIQVAAFADPSKARSLKHRIERRYDLQVVIRQDGGLHKVVVGPLTSKSQQAALSRSLERWGIQQVHPVQ